MRAIVYPAKISGSQVAPASKSSMQRACAAALLHHGQTHIFNPGHSNDDLAALEKLMQPTQSTSPKPEAQASR
jgi:3-phosphoshikimate 1-carboxyvinyltransferase